MLAVYTVCVLMLLLCLSGTYLFYKIIKNGRYIYYNKKRKKEIFGLTFVNKFPKMQSKKAKGSRRLITDILLNIMEFSAQTLTI